MIRRPAVLGILVIVLASCSTAQGQQPEPRQLTVLAAASLTETFTTVASRLESKHPGLDAKSSFGASSTLAEQIVAGALADVFAAASPETMATVTDAKRAAGEPIIFARNVLEIAVPKGNSAGIRSLRDFGRTDLRLAVCDVRVPCGAAATKVFAAANVQAQPDTLETDVKATLAKVQLGEVDAALVYATDVHAAQDAVDGIPFPEADQAVNDYLIVRLSQTQNPTAAQDFIDEVMSDEGQQTLQQAGFLPPT